MSGSYHVLIGLNYTGLDGTERRVEAGAVVQDIPTDAVSWLLEQGCIEPADVTSAKE